MRNVCVCAVSRCICHKFSWPITHQKSDPTYHLLQHDDPDDEDKYQIVFKAFKMRHAKLVMPQNYLLQLYQQIYTIVVLLYESTNKFDLSLVVPFYWIKPGMYTNWLGVPKHFDYC